MDIYKKTEKGQKVVKDRSVALPSKQRMAFILFDGKKPLNDIVLTTRGIGITPADIEALIRLELIELVDVEAASQETVPESASYYTEIGSVGGIFTPTGAVTNDSIRPVPPSEYQARYALAYPEAVGLTSSLGLRGFKLNLAVESAMGYQDLVALLPKMIEVIGRERCQNLLELLVHPLASAPTSPDA